MGKWRATGASGGAHETRRRMSEGKRESAMGQPEGLAHFRIS